MLAFELEQNEMLSLFVKGLPLENLLISPCIAENIFEVILSKGTNWED